MNRVNYVPGRELTAADLNGLQGGIEEQLGEMATLLLPRHIAGMEVSGTAQGLSVAAGYGWDTRGRRLQLTAATDVDVSAVQRPAQGQYRWLIVHAAYLRSSRGSVADISGVSAAAYYDDAVQIGVALGPPFSSSDIGVARGTGTGRPAAPDGAVTLGLLVLDHATPWDTLGDVVTTPQTSQQQQRAVPVGVMCVWPGSENIPEGWLLCDNSAISRSDYPALYAAIGHSWGIGDGATTFNLPAMTALQPQAGLQGGAYWIICAQ